MKTLNLGATKVELPEPGSATQTECPGNWQILQSGDARYRYQLIREGKKFWLQFGGRTICGEILEAGVSAQTGVDSDLIAQFPGKIKKLLVKTGDQVKEGQPLVQVEAMKMEFTIHAAVAGRIGKIHFTEAQQIQPGDRFLDLEDLQ